MIKERLGNPRLASRIARIFERLISELKLNLDGLTIYTEAASGHYLHTPILAAVAGAERVFAITRDSNYGSRDEIRQATIEQARAWGVNDRIEVVFERKPEQLERADVITNTGFVRPIDKALIECLKPTAVIPLMWETWEMRESEFDLSACKDRGILVLGTDEAAPPFAMYPYAGFLGTKLLFELGLEGHKTSVLLLGNSGGMGREMDIHFRSVGIEVDWFTNGEGGNSYSKLGVHYLENAHRYDAILLVEHSCPTLLIGEGGLIQYGDILQLNPATGIGVVTGNLDIPGVVRSGLTYFPDTLRPFGHMSYQPCELGPLPVLGLYATGLKIGEVMARARLAGLSTEIAARVALGAAPAMDFPEGLSWVK